MEKTLHECKVHGIKIIQKGDRIGLNVKNYDEIIWSRFINNGVFWDGPISIDIPLSIDDKVRRFYAELEEEKNWKSQLPDYRSLSEDDKQIINNIKKNGLVLDTMRNVHKKQVPILEIVFERGKFWQQRVACFSSQSLGLGICQCMNHPTYKIKSLSLADVLEIAKEKMAVKKEDE